MTEVVLKAVDDAENVIARIKGKKTEAELIEEQKKRKQEPLSEPDDHKMGSLLGRLAWIICVSRRSSALLPREQREIGA